MPICVAGVVMGLLAGAPPPPLAASGHAHQITHVAAAAAGADLTCLLNSGRVMPAAQMPYAYEPAAAIASVSHLLLRAVHDASWL
jgi:hypothetical protein